MSISPRPVVKILLRSVPSTNKQRLSDQLNLHMQTKQTILQTFHTNTVKIVFIILNRKFDFLNNIMDIFGCADFISNVQARTCSRVSGTALSCSQVAVMFQFWGRALSCCHVSGTALSCSQCVDMFPCLWNGTSPPPPPGTIMFPGCGHVPMSLGRHLPCSQCVDMFPCLWNGTIMFPGCGHVPMSLGRHYHVPRVRTCFHVSRTALSCSQGANMFPCLWNGTIMFPCLWDGTIMFPGCGHVSMSLERHLSCSHSRWQSQACLYSHRCELWLMREQWLPSSSLQRCRSSINFRSFELLFFFQIPPI